VRLYVALIALAWVFLLPTPGQAVEFPYTAYVTTDDVYVRSGPSEEYYPTDKLKTGTPVEIYRHDPGGWCAIRPPEGSFSWVSGRFLDKPNRDKVAKVASERVASRVGSRLSDTRDVIQVRLNKDEFVEVLGSETSPEGQDERITWYKIAPPSGEFRWIHGKYIDPDYQRSGLSKPPPKDRVARADADVPDEPPPPRRFTSSGSANESPLSSTIPPRSSAAAGASGALAPPPVFRTLSPEEVKRELEDLDVELSVMLAADPQSWNFDRLRPRAENLQAQAQAGVDRGKARILVGRIAKFEELKRRNDAVQMVRFDTERRSGPYVRLSSNEPQVLPTSRGPQRYDGVGRLSPVAAPAAGGPRYALVERDGAIRCYVTPAPGVNLQNYVGQEVGIAGVRGYMPEQRAQHLMAKHVQILEGPTLR
jgi:hypothetical protein